MWLDLIIIIAAAALTMITTLVITDRHQEPLFKQSSQNWGNLDNVRCLIGQVCEEAINIQESHITF